MTNLDLYAYCPCGSGKKIKFCKCRSSLDQMDRVIRMINGDQIVAALDRLTQILKEHPDAAWALSIRGELLFSLSETESLVENAERFIRLQPDNRLALTQMACAHLVRGEVSAATRAMLESIAETANAFESLQISAMYLLLEQHLSAETKLTATFFQRLLEDLYAQNEDQMDRPPKLSDLKRSAALHPLHLQIPQIDKRPRDVPWGERFDEAARLIQSARSLLAEPKLQSLEREFPGQVAIQQGLLQCAIFRGDLDAQVAYFVKLSNNESLDTESRALYQTYAFLLDAEGQGAAVGHCRVAYACDDLEQASLICDADPRVARYQEEVLKQLVVDENETAVPRHAFQLCSHPISGEEVPSEEAFPLPIADIILFGRQTDREARMWAVFHECHREDVEAWLKESNFSTEPVEQHKQPVPYWSLEQIATPQGLKHGFNQAALYFERFIRVVDAKAMDHVASAKLDCLGGKSLEETADDDTLTIPRTALLLLLASKASSEPQAAAVDSLCQRISVSLPKPVIDSAQAWDELMPGYFSLADMSHATASIAYQAVLVGSDVDADLLASRASRRLLDMDADQFEPETVSMRDGQTHTFDRQNLISAKCAAHMLLSKQRETSPAEALEHAQQADQLAIETGIDRGSTLLTKMVASVRAASPETLQQSVDEYVEVFSGQPDKMMMLQQFLTSLGVLPQENEPRAAEPRQPAPPPQETGIWTPDQGSPRGGDAKKLFIPGQD